MNKKERHQRARLRERYKGLCEDEIMRRIRERAFVECCRITVTRSLCMLKYKGKKVFFIYSRLNDDPVTFLPYEHRLVSSYLGVKDKPPHATMTRGG